MAKTLSTLILELGDLLELHAGAVDPSAGAGVPAPVGSYYFRSTDATQWKKIAAGNAAWVSVSAQIGNPQRFSYLVTGAEPDLTALVINLPAARATATYMVFISQGQATSILGGAVLTASKTVALFVLQLTGAATAGDVFNFNVVDGT